MNEDESRVGAVKETVPDEYYRLGWSGVFTVEADLSAESAEEVAAFEARLPARVPFGSNSGWLALRLNRAVDPPTVVLVRRDADALVEAFVRSP